MLPPLSASPHAQELWRLLEGMLRERLLPFDVRVSKTQLSLCSGCVFACISAKKEKLIVTFGLPSRVDSPRICQATEPYPQRWTHHMPVGEASELDEELINWLAAAQAFAIGKKKR